MIRLSAADAALIEAIEVDAWRDMYAAMPSDFKATFNPELIELGEVAVARCKAIPFVHFNAVLDLGMRATPATEATLDRALAALREAGVQKATVFHHPLCQPAELKSWLSARGFEEKPGWDRVYHFGDITAAAPPSRGDVELVTAATVDAWAGFIDRIYGMPTSPWLKGFGVRNGWTHAMLKRGGAVVAVRSMFVGPHGAWFGVEAPIPGLMAPSYEDDHCLLHALIQKGSSQGATAWVADVEAPHATGNGPAYDRWRTLGFEIAYHRAHFVGVL